MRASLPSGIAELDDMGTPEFSVWMAAKILQRGPGPLTIP